MTCDFGGKGVNLTQVRKPVIRFHLTNDTTTICNLSKKIHELLQGMVRYQHRAAQAHNEKSFSSCPSSRGTSCRRSTEIRLTLRGRKKWGGNNAERKGGGEREKRPKVSEHGFRLRQHMSLFLRIRICLPPPTVMRSRTRGKSQEEEEET